jgi:hypothetical protein
MRQCFRISRWSSVGTGVVGTVNPHSTLQYSLLIRNVTNAVINAVLYSVVLWIARSLMPSHIAQPTLSPRPDVIVKIKAIVPRAHPMDSEFRGFFSLNGAREATRPLPRLDSGDEKVRYISWPGPAQ